MAEHKHPNYMAIFYYLAILTAVELGVIFLPIPKIFIAALLCVFAVWKAALVAMYFMHLEPAARERSPRWPRRCAGWRRASAGGCGCGARAAAARRSTAAGSR